MLTWVLAIVMVPVAMGAWRPGQPSRGARSDAQPPAQSRGTDAAAKSKAQPQSTLQTDADAVPLAPGEWRVFVEPEGQIFPALILATATLKKSIPSEQLPGATTQKPAANSAKTKTTPAPLQPLVLGDPDSLIGVHLRAPASGQFPCHVRVELQANPLMDTAVLEAELPTADREYLLQPTIAFNFDALGRVRQARPLNVAFHVVLDGHDLGQKIVTAEVHTINDCLYGYGDADDKNHDHFQDLTWMFAAYVNEDHPAVRALLREAQNSGITDAFDNYASGDPSQVLQQVWALWDLLQTKDIRYADIGTTSSESDLLWSMHVRFLDESLADGQVNCVDGSVLLASLLRKIGIQPFLVLEPGHMYLGFYLDRQGRTSACLETTLLGAREEELGRWLPNRTLAKAVPPAARNRPSWKTFNAALDCATKEFRKYRRRYAKDDDPEYQTIDIAAARHEGVMPIAASLEK